MNEVHPRLTDVSEGEEMARRHVAPARAQKIGRAAEKEGLTRREREILGCFARGWNSAAIARRLGISVTTVRNHSQRILGKLRVHSRLEAVARGYATGLLPTPASASGARENP